MGKNTGKVREFCQSGKVGTMEPPYRRNIKFAHGNFGNNYLIASLGQACSHFIRLFAFEWVHTLVLTST